MKRLLLLGTVLLGVAGCQPSEAETLITDQIKTMNDLADAITKKAPDDKIKQLRARFDANQEKIKGLVVTKEERQRLGERYDVEWVKASGRLWEAEVPLSVDVRKEVERQQEKTPW